MVWQRVTTPSFVQVERCIYGLWFEEHWYTSWESKDNNNDLMGVLQEGKMTLHANAKESSQKLPSRWRVWYYPYASLSGERRCPVFSSLSPLCAGDMKIMICPQSQWVFIDCCEVTPNGATCWVHVTQLSLTDIKHSLDFKFWEYVTYRAQRIGAYNSDDTTHHCWMWTHTTQLLHLPGSSVVLRKMVGLITEET